jgi:hypothetical protein
MVTKEDVDKAKAAAVEADAAVWKARYVVARAAADEAATEAVVHGAWDNYIKLKREYENNTNMGDSDATQITRA